MTSRLGKAKQNFPRLPFLVDRSKHRKMLRQLKGWKTFPAWRQRGVHCSQTTVTKHERWKRGSQSDVRPRKRLCKNPNDMISISDLEDSTELMKNHWISDSSERSTRNPCQANSTNVKKKKGGKSKPVPKKWNRPVPKETKPAPNSKPTEKALEPTAKRSGEISGWYSKLFG